MKNEVDSSFEQQANRQAGGGPDEPRTMAPNFAPQHVSIAPTFPESAKKFGPQLEDLARRSAPGSATSNELTYIWRR
jgi:hypothetical protein